MKLSGLIFCTVVSVLSVSCQKKSDGDAKAPGPVFITSVSKEHYMSGPQFCEYYKSITGLETGKYVTVPKDYNDRSKGTLQLYTYMTGKFDPAKPSYIYLDGGPGQNTHGLMGNYTNGKSNELRFDQRGLGCSAPPTYEEYKNADLYSTANTVRDLEEIRKAYGINKWSVYGVSYGTVPATIYGSKYPDRVRSVVIEGIVGPIELLDSKAYKASKLNLVLNGLTSAQRTTFGELIVEKSEIGKSFRALILGLFYSDRGMGRLVEMLPNLIDKNGTRQMDLLNEVTEKMSAREHRFPMPQQPGAADENIFQIIYCRDLGYRKLTSTVLTYDSVRGFSTEFTSESDRNNECNEVGVSQKSETAFIPSENKVSANIYYFQGSHDGATLAKGAYLHWKTVPTGKSHFFLARKGGHNPNLSRLENDDSTVASAQGRIFTASILDEGVNVEDVRTVNNSMSANQNWLYYSKFPTETTALDKELEGINRHIAQ